MCQKKIFLSLFSLVCSQSLLVSENQTTIPLKETEYTIHIKDAQNLTETLQKSHYLVLDIYADWCGPCKLAAPHFKKVSEKLGSKYSFAKLNEKDNQEALKILQVEGFPTFIFFKDGKEVGREIGYMNEKDLEKAIHTYFKE